MAIAVIVNVMPVLVSTEPIPETTPTLQMCSLILGYRFL